MSALTPRQKDLKKKYTRIAELDCEHVAFFLVEHQSFSIHDGATTKKRADYYRDMFAIAIDRMIEKEEMNAGYCELYTSGINGSTSCGRVFNNHADVPVGLPCPYCGSPIRIK